MTSSSPQERGTIRRPHPLASDLIERLRGRPGSRVLDFCAGSGRNGAALREAGYAVVALEDSVAERGGALPAELGEFAAVISTHGLLHGTVGAIAQRMESIAEHLEPNGPFYATFGSARDARFGRGRRIDASTYAPLDGDERGVAHAYFTRAALEGLLHRHFVVERLEERYVDAIAGSWAHPTTPLSQAVHWFVVARRLPMRSSIGLDALA
ncbi:MAG: methyltransferase domain-containing protein [Candidatus Tumulicola sp.]